MSAISAAEPCTLRPAREPAVFIASSRTVRFSRRERSTMASTPEREPVVARAVSGKGRSRSNGDRSMPPIRIDRMFSATGRVSSDCSSSNFSRASASLRPTTGARPGRMATWAGSRPWAATRDFMSAYWSCARPSACGVTNTISA